MQNGTISLRNNSTTYHVENVRCRVLLFFDVRIWSVWPTKVFSMPIPSKKRGNSSLNDLVISPWILVQYIMASCDQTILVTGANGYVASHVVRELLKKGFIV